jgi:hypothetical protein
VVIVDKIDKMFALPPEFLLDHYWKVLSLIMWRGPIEREDKESFTASDLMEQLLRDAQTYKDKHPTYSRACLRSIAVIKEVMDELVSLGLLIKDGESFRKTDDFSRFYYLLRHRVRKSLRRYIAWAILYLHNQKVNEFSTTELIVLLSYHDKDYTDEIPHLIKWKGNGWFKLLKKFDSEWKLLEEPLKPSSPMLLADIDDRLSYAILELSKTKDKFRTDEIIEKLRELERRSAEKTLKRLGLKFENGKWKTNDETLESVKKLLEAETERWPSLGVLVFKNPYFRLQSRTIYVDIPNTVIQDFLTELGRICYEYKDPQKIYEKAKELAITFNQNLEGYLGEWLLFVVRKQPFGSKPFGVQIKIDWIRFRSFLDEFAKKELPLREKYSYIFNCRALSLVLVLRGDSERVQRDVKEICREEIEQIHQDLENLISRMDEAKDYLFKITLYRRTIPIEPATLEYFPEMISTLRALNSLVENGTISTCYREMRKVLENLSWVIFDDLLLYKTSTLRKRKHSVDFLIPYRSVSREWYEWASSQKGLVIRKLKDLKNKVDRAEGIYLHRKDKGEHLKQKQIEEIFFKRISYPLFLLFMGGVNIQVPKKLERLIPQYEAGTLKRLATEDMKNILKDLRCEHLSKSDEAMIEEIMDTTIEKSAKIVPPYPSPEFVLGFVSKTLSVELLEPYKEYSQFVHSYFTSWHIFPFSSVLEFKVFRYELSIFNKILMQLIDSYLKELFD